MPLSPSLAAQRFGFGQKPGRSDALGESLGGPDPAQSLHPGQEPAAALTERNRMREELAAAREIGDAAKAEVQKRIQGEVSALRHGSLRLAIARAVDTPDGYRERLVRFWADHFTILAHDPRDIGRVALYADEVIRPNIAAPFAVMLKAAILHPLMLVYLDQSKSVGPGSRFGQRRGLGLNENLARELLELHTLGIEGGYSQDDVRQVAKVLTGFVVSRDGEVNFAPDRAEPGAETVLGKRYGGLKPHPGDITALLEDLAVHPATARHMARKLAVHFVADDPPAGLVEDLADLWRDSGGDLGLVSRALVSHPLAHRREQAKARQPFEFLVGALRALGLGGEEVMGWNDKTLRQTVRDPLRQMAQPWLSPIGPDGWEEEFDRWITPQALARRISWAMRVPARLVTTLPDARAFLAATLPDAEAPLPELVARAETNAEAIGLVLASPHFNRR